MGDAGLAAGASIGGAAISGIASAIAASRQRAFAKEMFRNRYQYTMQDMRAAGLNPMLAAKLGGGQPPQGSQAQVPNIADAISGAFRSRREERMQGITRGTAKTNALTADAQRRTAEASALIREAEVTKAQMEARYWTTKEGRAALEAGLIPGGPVGVSAFGVKRVGDFLGRLPKRPMEPARGPNQDRGAVPRLFKRMRFQR